MTLNECNFLIRKRLNQTNAIDTKFPHVNKVFVFLIFNSCNRVSQTRYITSLIATESDIIKEGCHWYPRKTGCFIRYYITLLFPHAWANFHLFLRKTVFTINRDVIEEVICRHKHTFSLFEATIEAFNDPLNLHNNLIS